uniref:Uncharacterized protein n=1 Tax=Siphoviridae sp. ctGFb30 TaxID=2826219 RepID=A0A8S5MFP8_9CAUD|nr:MAG TPA: hypothetical protein [Siphoviridae sp. ctGFb30]
MGLRPRQTTRVFSIRPRSRSRRCIPSGAHTLRTVALWPGSSSLSVWICVMVASPSSGGGCLPYPWYSAGCARVRAVAFLCPAWYYQEKRGKERHHGSISDTAHTAHDHRGQGLHVFRVRDRGGAQRARAAGRIAGSMNAPCARALGVV